MRKEAVEQELFDIFLLQLGLNRAANHLRAAPEYDHRCRLALLTQLLRQQVFLGLPTAEQERPTLPRLKLVAFTLQALVHRHRQRQVHIVAAKEDVVSDGDSLKL